MVMAGSLFSGYNESAGEVIEIEGKRYKQYFGSASYNNTRSKKNVEGKCILVQHKGEMQKLLWDIDDGLRSSISYAGGLNMYAFKDVSWGVRQNGVRQ
jgi:GMP reductase